MEQVADFLCAGVTAGAPDMEWDPKYSSAIAPWGMGMEHEGWLGKFLGMKEYLTHSI